MPARIKRRKIVSNKPKLKKKYLFLFFIFVIISIGMSLLLGTYNRNAKDKLSLIVKNKDSSMSIIVFDIKSQEIYNLNIPANTEIEVIGERGLWKVKSLWDLGEQEGLGGELAARSVTMSLKLPIYAWADEQALGLANLGLKTSFVALFSFYESSLNFKDKTRLFIFASKVKNTRRISINLGETALLERRKLSDEEDGYRVSQTLPQSIAAIFSEPAFTTDFVRVSIKDATQKVNLAKSVGSVIEVLGGKVSSVEVVKDYRGVCIIKSKKENTLKILLKIFKCEEFLIDPEQSFDIEMTLGEKFLTKN